ncbi:MAG: DUF3237 domain-containing protein [Rhodococcus sp. (in: high G+C Gram-positive bacteria)]
MTPTTAGSAPAAAGSAPAAAGSERPLALPAYPPYDCAPAPFAATPGLEYRFTIRALVDPERVIGHIGAGSLLYIPITGGTVSGGGVDGTVLGGGGDWAVENDVDVFVEARYQFQTHDGTMVDVVNTGIGRFTDDEHTTVGYFATRPIFRVADERLRHLTDRVYLGWAVSTPEYTEIDIYEVTSPR